MKIINFVVGETWERPERIAMKSPTSFFRIVLPYVMRDHKLMIPEGFAKVHRNELSSSATLIVPGCPIWDIGIEKSGKKLYFHDGWKEFSEHHAIGCWFFILFKYEGNSKFNVHIFDLTATEISYPRNNRKQNSVPDEEGDDSVEILSSSRPKVSNDKTTGERCNNSFSQNVSEFAPEYSVRIKTHGIQFSSLKRLRSELGYFTRNKRHKLGDGEQITISENETPNLERLLEKPQKKKREESKNVEKLQAGTEEPRRSRRANPNEREAKDGQHSTKGTGYVESTAQKEDELQPTVNIEEEVDFSVSKLTGSQLVTTPARETETMISKTENPSFKVILRPYHFGRGSIMNVSVRFVRDHLKISSNATVILSFGGRQWKVFLMFSNGRPYLSRGWSTFVQENQLSVEDICVFELIKDNQTTFKVFILRGGDASKGCPIRLDSTTQNKDEQQLTVKSEREVEVMVTKMMKRQLDIIPQTNKAIIEAMKFKPENPSFMVLLRPFNVKPKCLMNVPVDFITKYLNISANETILLTFGGRKWEVILFHEKSGHCLRRGWSTFVEECQLLEGDVCVFELIKVENIVFKLSIFRAGDCDVGTNLQK